jgi:hypothetical protein
MVMHANPRVLPGQIKNLRAGFEAVGAVQGPEEIEMNLGLPLVIQRCPLWCGSLPDAR